jgi:ABC-2 type transport system permease protein
MKYWRETIAITQRILIELFRRKRSLILWSIFPVSILIINSLVIADQVKITKAEAFTNIAPSALVGAALFFSCLGGTIATIVAEREQQTLKRLFLSPLSGLSYFLGIFLAHSFIGIGQTLVIYTVASFWGGTFKGSILLGALIVLMIIISYVGLGFILSTQLAKRTEDVNSIVAAFGVPLLILGGAFFPTKFLPKELLNISKLNPIYHANEALVGVGYHGYNLDKISTHFQFLSAFVIVVVILGWLSYLQMINREKRL